MATAQEILNAVNDPNRSVANALRLCLQLPPVEVTPDFLTWVQRELDGYNNADGVPSYRQFVTLSRGVISNGAWRHTDVLVDIVGLSEAVQKWIDRPVTVFDGTAAIDDLVELATDRTGGSDLGIDWPVQATVLLNQDIGRGSTNVHQSYRFERVHKVIPRSRLVDILDRVRTRIASEVAPLLEDGEPSTRTTIRASPAITVTGSNNQIVTNSPAAALTQFNFSAGDLDGLIAALADLGAMPPDTDELRSIIEGEGDLPGRLMRALEWTKGQALDLPGNVLTGGLTTLILHHFGLA